MAHFMNSLGFNTEHEHFASCLLSCQKPTNVSQTVKKQLCFMLQITIYTKFLALYRVICLNITKTFNGFLGVYQTSIPLNYTFVRMTDFKNCYVIAGHSDTHL